MGITKQPSRMKNSELSGAFVDAAKQMFFYATVLGRTLGFLRRIHYQACRRGMYDEALRMDRTIRGVIATFEFTVSQEKGAPDRNDGAGEEQSQGERA